MSLSTISSHLPSQRGDMHVHSERDVNMRHALGEKWPQIKYIARQQSRLVAADYQTVWCRRFTEGSRDAERMFTKLVVNSGQPSHRFMIYVFPSALAPSPPLPWEPQVLTMRVVEWFHTGWGFQPGVLNAHGFGGAGNNAVCALPSEYFFSPSPNSSSPLFSPLFSHLLSAVVPTASSLQSRDIACAFIIFGNSVSDKIMSCVTFITFLSIVLKGNLLQIFT